MVSSLAGDFSPLACAGAEIERGSGGVQPRFGVNQERSRGDNPLIQFRTSDQRVEGAAPRAKYNLDSVEHSRPAFDKNQFLSTGVDDGAFRNGRHKSLMQRNLL